ncbi:MAG: Acyl-CoA dehydrogenase [Syntrophorhabdus sp. PtaU1.Bin153]|nr:MAG: Acyl-CoA dehydrogenase [Syntrophorhabdus sp. PtaU1.Bin153]
MDYFDLDANLSKQDLALKEAAHKFAETVMRPISIKLDKMSAEEAIAPDSPYWDFMRKAYSLGYHKLAFPEELGGQGLTPFQLALVMEELAWGSFGLTLALHTSFDAVAAIEGGEELMQEFTFPYINCTDGSYIGCWAITEPDHGSDPLAFGLPIFRDPKLRPQCRARLDGDEYVINGQKAAWVSGAPTAKTIFLWCQIDPTKGFAGNGMFVFSLDRPGVSKGKPCEMIGTRELNQGEIYFDDVRVPKKCLVVGPDHYEAAQAVHVAMTTSMVGLWGVGLARAGFEEALKYARVREQGGKLLVDHSFIQAKLFDMFAKIEAARALCRSAVIYNFGMLPEKRVPEYGFAAKTFGTRTALEVCTDAIQILGANGLTPEYLLEKLFRDARVTTICDGSNDSLAIFGGNHLGQTYPRKRHI